MLAGPPNPHRAPAALAAARVQRAAPRPQAAVGASGLGARREVHAAASSSARLAAAVGATCATAALQHGRRTARRSLREAQETGEETSEELDEDDRKFVCPRGSLTGSVFLFQLPLEMPDALPSWISPWLPRHSVVICETEEGNIVAFDFGLKDRPSLKSAWTLFWGGGVPGAIKIRPMQSIPRGALRIGPALQGTRVEDVQKKVDDGFDTELTFKTQDCNIYAQSVLELVLEQTEAPGGQRLYSTICLDTLENEGEAVYKQPNVASAVLLIAGCAVGAGVLALPAVTQPVGFVPSTVALVATWIYLVFTGLLVAEVALETMAKTGQRTTSMITMASMTAGPRTANLTTVMYLFFHIATLTAFVSRGGEMVVSVIPGISAQAGSILFTAVCGGFMAVNKGSDIVEQVNNLLTAVVITAFFGLLLFTVPQADPSALFGPSAVANWSGGAACIPIMLQGLSFQSVVPTICASLEGDRRKIQQAIVIGSAIPLIMFVIWNGTLLAVQTGLERGMDPLMALAISKGPVMATGIGVFSAAAVLTSFIGFVVSLTDFYGDAFKPSGASEPEDTLMTRVRDYGLTLVPPLAVACYDPSLFLQALDKAGAFGVSFLFGLLPAWMALRQRADGRKVLEAVPGFLGGYERGPLAPGGSLAVVIAGACGLKVIVDATLKLF